MIDIKIKDIQIGHGGLVHVVDNQLSFSPIDENLFLSGSFSDVVYDYFYDNWGEGYDVDCEEAKWMRDNSETLWFDIQKDVNGDYYYVAGDNSGIVYYEQVYLVIAIYEDYEIRFNEDDNYYYIRFLNKNGEYAKEDWTLEESILDMKKKLEEL